MEQSAAPSPIPKGGTKPSESSVELDQRISNLIVQIGLSLPPAFPTPKLALQFEDLAHAGSSTFLKYIPDPHEAFRIGLSAIVKSLYSAPPFSKDSPVRFDPSLPPTSSVTLILRNFTGVAYTTASGTSPNSKEIHFSLSYIAGTAHLDDPRAELLGVLVHELVHCFQHTTPPESSDVPYPPGGLVEGIADFVRLKAGYRPPHWERPCSSADLPPSWDAGYQRTAFFLEWLEDVHVGCGAIGMLNDRLLRAGYLNEAPDGDGPEDGGDARDYGEGFWAGLFGLSVLKLWKLYAEYLDQEGATKQLDGSI
jgi:hypothetical protein